MLVSSSMWQAQSHMSLLSSFLIVIELAIAIPSHFLFLFQRGSLSSYCVASIFLVVYLSPLVWDWEWPMCLNGEISHIWFLSRGGTNHDPLMKKCTGTGLVSADFSDLFASIEMDAGCFSVFLLVRNVNMSFKSIHWWIYIFSLESLRRAH